MSRGIFMDFERPYFNNAQEFLRLSARGFFEFLEMLSLCFLPCIPGARLEREQIEISV